MRPKAGALGRQGGRWLKPPFKTHDFWNSRTPEWVCREIENFSHCPFV
jgi:hypothetical protein